MSDDTDQLERICLNCDFWFPPKRQALTTETRGQCNCIGGWKGDEPPRAVDGCGAWEPYLG